MLQVFTDLAANIPQELVESARLGIVPIHCTVNGKLLDVAKDGFDGPAFYAAMRAGAKTSTSMPAPAAFTDAFRPVLERGDDLIYIGMSSGISGTVGLARTVAAELAEEFPARHIAVVDSKAASLGEGLPVLFAAELRDKGLGFDEVLRQTQDKCDHMYQIFTVEDLEYLRRGGRLHSAVAVVGNMLNVKPILFGDADGHIVLRHMNVGRKRSLETLAAKYRQSCVDKAAPVGLAHCDSPADARQVADKLRQAGCTGEITIVCYEPVTGSHVGPGTVALFFYGPKR